MRAKYLLLYFPDRFPEMLNNFLAIVFMQTRYVETLCQNSTII